VDSSRGRNGLNEQSTSAHRGARWRRYENGKPPEARRCEQAGGAALFSYVFCRRSQPSPPVGCSEPLGSSKEKAYDH